jgi:hypothetical protein
LLAAPTPAGAQSACVSDAFRLCSAFIPNESKVKSCLTRNKSKVSPACRREMSGRR